MKKNFIYFIFFVSINISLSQAQEITQTIRGKISDKESQYPLAGAMVSLTTDTSALKGTAADEEGNFRLDNVPIGRHKIKISYLGYKDLVLSDLIVNSAKELILAIEMEQSSVSLEEVVISATDKAGSVNEMALVGARTFSVNETERYAGSRQDPARMASNFAGAQGTNDTRNDIVVRGNSPLGILWRLDDINIPNPNHFAVAGSSGGPISILNTKWLTSSDFMTAAFPAEYGNSIAGVFDVKMRKGNNEKHEFTGQFGLFGTELMAEGPLSKKNKSSYLVSYRYATLAIFGALGIKLGTTAVPRYQDGAIKLNFPTKKSGTFSIFGIAGKSKIDIVLSTNKSQEEEIYGQKDRDQYFSTNMGVLGISHAYSINTSTFTKATLAFSSQWVNSKHNYFRKNAAFDVIETRPQLRYTFREDKMSLVYFVNKKIGSRHVIKTGLFLDQIFYNFSDSVYSKSDTVNGNAIHKFNTRLNIVTASTLLQPYIQWKAQINERIAISSGLHLQYFTMNKSIALEPRVSIKYLLKENQSISLGYGLHSQLQPSYIYFIQNKNQFGETVLPNKNTGFTKSHHFVMSYDRRLGSFARLKVETYYQHLFNVPVTTRKSAFSMVNQGSGFSRFFPDSLINKGTANNYGVELTIEKFFSKHYFLMFTTSLFNSTYKGSDNIERKTDFNGRFASNLLAGTEYTIGKKQRTVFFDGIKLTWAGGRRYGTVDTIASKKIQEVVYKSENMNEKQFKNYFRFDLRFGFRRNNRRVTHEFALDFINILDTKNILGITYSPDPTNPSKEPFVIEYQLGRLPVFYYKLDF